MKIIMFIIPKEWKTLLQKINLHGLRIRGPSGSGFQTPAQMEVPMEKQCPSFGKRELILLTVIFSAVFAFCLFNRFRHPAPAAVVEVSVIDENSGRTVLETFSLYEDIEYTIVTEPASPSEPAGTNHLIIKDGEAWISEADCPNHDCVKKGKISRNGEMLVCIPHRLTVSILGE